jgi:hypothetical protein
MTQETLGMNSEGCANQLGIYRLPIRKFKPHENGAGRGILLSGQNRDRVINKLQRFL